MDEPISLSEARKLAKYYGNICQKHHEVDVTDEQKRIDWECLSYCRTIILTKSRKLKKIVNNLNAKKNEIS